MGLWRRTQAAGRALIEIDDGDPRWRVAWVIVPVLALRLLLDGYGVTADWLDVPENVAWATVILSWIVLTARPGLRARWSRPPASARVVASEDAPIGGAARLLLIGVFVGALVGAALALFDAAAPWAGVLMTAGLLAFAALLLGDWRRARLRSEGPA